MEVSTSEASAPVVVKRYTEELVSKWVQIKKTPKREVPMPTNAKTGVDLEVRMRELYGTLLSEARDIGYQYGHKEEWRGGTGILQPAATSSNPCGKADKTSIKNKRFASSRWRTWNSDYCLLEDLSRKEIEEQSHGTLKASSASRLTKKRRKGKAAAAPQLSRLPGPSFGLPKDPDRYDYFDLHALGNRNDVAQLFTKSLGFDMPRSIHQTSLLHASANVDPEAFGAPTRNLKGGVINSGPARGPAHRGLTAGCDMPPVDRPMGSPKLVGFRGGPRDDAFGHMANPGGGSPTMYAYLERKDGLAFAREARGDGGANPPRDAPGVGTYELPRMFETKSDSKPRDLTAVLSKIQGSRDYRDIANEDMAKLVGFAQGCSRQEHILYGMCLDGLCGRRSQVEMSMLQMSNWRRLGVESDLQCQEALLCVPVRALPDTSAPKSPLKSTNTTAHHGASAANTIITTVVSGTNSLRADIGQAEREERLAQRRTKVLTEERRLWTRTLVADPAESMTPLHMAAFRGDADAIARMHKLGEDINVRQGEEQETPLHVAVRRGQVEGVRAILSLFRGTVAVDAKDDAGDTALHIAARGGRKEIVEMLCDAGADCRLRNADKQLALELTSKHPIKQVLRIHEDYLRLQDELRVVQQRRERVTTRALQTNISLQDYRPTTSEDRRPTTNDIENSRGSQRSKILEVGEDYDAARESIKFNSSLFRVSSAPKVLDDPSKNSFILGYYPPEPKAKTKIV